MSDKEEKEAAEPLTEEQRIEQLEKKVGTSKVVLMVVALMLIMILSVSVTAFSLFVAKGSDKDNDELNAKITKLEQEIVSLNSLIAEQDEQIVALSNKVPDIKQQLSNSSNGVILSLLVEQEDSNQVFLESARSAIYDLAHMVPGSRTWLDLYSEQIDTAIAQSNAREITLKKLQSGGSAPSKSEDVKEENFFDDF